MSVAVVIDEVQFKLHEKNICLSFHARQPHIALFDRQKIIQVLHNLIDNAFKFSLPETTIAITIEEIDIAGATFQQIRIKDQGIGLPETELETIFDKFKQSIKTKNGAGGTGLGLAICRGILEAHSGRIWAENNSEGGSSFYFIFPVPGGK
ncbi:MAG: ATP-binding protein [Thermodesulfobacteriota bacterium]|nr:ATP-binding protein [Thermodesulfobacteriota bacterium]